MVLLLLLESQAINRNTKEIGNKRNSFSNQTSNQVIKRSAFTVFMGLKDFSSPHFLCI